MPAQDDNTVRERAALHDAVRAAARAFCQAQQQEAVLAEAASLRRAHGIATADSIASKENLHATLAHFLLVKAAYDALP